MRISAVETWPVKVPPPARGGGEWHFVKITTDSGLYGWGEMASLGANSSRPRSLPDEVSDLARRFLIGQDPLRREWIWQRFYDAAMVGHPDYVRGSILSGLDIALWDIAGKHFQAPVHELLGGRVRDKVRAYSYIYDDPSRPEYQHLGGWWPLWLEPQLCARRAAEMAAEGFGALKLDPIHWAGQWGEPAKPWQLSLEALDRAEQTVRLVREAVGSACDILIGTHGQMTPSAAVRLARRLEPYDPLWLEEPVPPENASQMARVADKTTIPIATGERLFSIHDFARVFEARAVDIAQPDLGSCGGISQCMKIAAMAQACYVQMAPHVWGGPGITAAALQVAACITNFLILESIYKSDGFFNEILTSPFRWEDGCLVVPNTPGLGIDFNEEALKAFALS
jgi:2-dehydro-3-deoxyphosphogalactonate aldolase